MQREQGSHESATPSGAGNELEDPEQKDGVGRMEQQASQVITLRVLPEKLTIQQERQPGQGMPETGIQIRKSPAYAFQTQTALDVAVRRDVNRVIIVHEAGMYGWPERAKSRDHQERTNRGRAPRRPPQDCLPLSKERR